MISWYDLETSGLSAKYDQIVEYFSIKTDDDLNVIEGSDIHLRVKPRPDVVPSVTAFLVHRQPLCAPDAITELEMLNIVKNDLLSQTTTIAGYNNNSFDDEFLRFGFYRNMMNPYSHEWKNRNRRIDLYKLLQLVRSLRPDTIEWPEEVDGKVSMKLADVAKANGIDTGKEHEAKSDVLTTIQVAKLIKDRNPRIWDYFMNLSDKNYVTGLVNAQRPLIHVERYYDVSKNKMSVLLPVVYDRTNKSSMICVDLTESLDGLVQLSVEEIRDEIFTKRELRTPKDHSIHVKNIAVNKSPMIVDFEKMITPELAERSGINIEEVMENADVLRKLEVVKTKLRDAFEGEVTAEDDVHARLYADSFPTNNDSNLIERLPVKLADGTFNIESVGIFDMLRQLDDSEKYWQMMVRCKFNQNPRLAMRPRNEEEKVQSRLYALYIQGCLEGREGISRRSLADYEQELSTLRLEQEMDAEELMIIDTLNEHVDGMRRLLEGFRKMHDLDPKEQALVAHEPSM